MFVRSQALLLDLEVVLVSGFIFFFTYECLLFGVFFPSFFFWFNYTDYVFGLFNVADVSLSQKLQEELKYEQDAAEEASGATPEPLKSFLERGIWSVGCF